MKVKIKTKYLWTTGESADVSFNTINVSGHTDYETVPEPTAPPSGKLRVFADSSDNKLKVKKPNGVVVDLESGGGGSSQHNLLDGSVHPDTSATSVQRGMLIVGRLISGVIKWAGLVLGAAGKVLKSNGTDVVWGDVEWNEIVNKPTSFTPEVHDRTKHTYALLPNTAPTNPVEGDIWYDSAQGQKRLRYRDDTAVRTINDWHDLFNKPPDFPPSPHTHAPTDILPQGHNSGLNSDLLDGQHASAFAAAVHTHVKADITDFAHTHAPTDISPQGHNSGLNADLLDGDHASAFERIANKGVPGGYASLDSNGKVVQDPANATAIPTPNKIPIADSGGKLATGWLSDNLRTVSVGITVGDGVNPITTGVKGAIWIPISGTIVEWTILSTDGATPTTGSIEFDILKSTYSNYPTMTSIVGSGIKPNITNSNKGNGTPTGWSTTQINAGDCLRFDVTSVTSLKRVTLVLKVVKS